MDDTKQETAYSIPAFYPDRGPMRDLGLFGGTQHQQQQGSFGGGGARGVSVGGGGVSGGRYGGTNGLSRSYGGGGAGGGGGSGSYFSPDANNFIPTGLSLTSSPAASGLPSSSSLSSSSASSAFSGLNGLNGDGSPYGRHQGTAGTYFQPGSGSLMDGNTSASVRAIYSDLSNGTSSSADAVNDDDDETDADSNIPASRFYAMYKTLDNTYRIREVWADNLEAEMQIMMALVDDYQYVAMDTEFPGTVARPTTATADEYNYKTLKVNVDLLKIIQLGFTFCDDTGRHPPVTWQFNFKFSLTSDMYAQNSIDFLKECGVDFPAHETKGIDVQDFGEIIMTSGVVLNDDLTWITFHSGYDYGYLLKLLTCQALPDEEFDFLMLFKSFFPRVYDIKQILESKNHFHGGLNKLATQLDVTRIGPQHQAGSDSLLTAATFFKMRRVYFQNNIHEHYVGALYGFGEWK